MPWNGSGGFTRLHGSTGWTDDKNSAIFILSSRHDDHDNDIAGGLQLAITTDNQNKPASDFRPNLDNGYDGGSIALTWKNWYLRALRLVNSGFYSSFTPASLTGNRTVTVPDANLALSFFILKAAATSRTNTTTLAADPDLVVSLAASAKYDIEYFIQMGNVVTADTNGFKCDFTYSGTLIGNGRLYHYGFANSAAIAMSVFVDGNVVRTFSVVDPFAVDRSNFLYLRGTILTSTAGTWSLRWAQNSATGTSLAIGANSWMRVTLMP